MRINAPSPPVFTVPDTVPVADVGSVRPVNPISEDEPRRNRPGQEAAVASPAPAVEEAGLTLQDAAATLRGIEHL